MGFNFEEAYLVSIFVESVLFGLFLCTFSISAALLLRRRHKMTVLGVLLVMFALATAHIGNNFCRLLYSFVVPEGETATQRIVQSIPTPSFLLKNTLYVAQTLVGDGFLLYRVYVVCKGWRMAWLLLLCCLMASTAAGVMLLHSQAVSEPGGSIYASDLGTWLVTFFALTATTNVGSSVLIAWRIWTIHQKTRAITRGSALLRAAVLIIESGAIYTCCVLLLLALYLGKSLSHKVVLDAITQMIGIVFSLIIIRVGLGFSAEVNTTRATRFDTLFFQPEDEPSGTEVGMHRHISRGPTDIVTSSATDPYSLILCQNKIETQASSSRGDITIRIEQTEVDPTPHV